MKKFRVSITLFLLFFLFDHLFAKEFKLGIFDTTSLEEYKYKNFIELAKSVGFKVEYSSFAKILEKNSGELSIDSYDGIFFIIGIDFLKGMAKSFASQKFLNILQNFGSQKDKLVGLFLPPIGSANIARKSVVFEALLQRVGINLNGYDYFLKNFLNLLDIYLANPLEARANLFYTPLNLKKKFVSVYLSNRVVHDKYLTTLPIKQDYSQDIKLTLPYGLYFYNQNNKNHIFLSSSSLLNFSSIEESFHFCPSDFDLRRQMHNAIHETLWELKEILDQKNDEISTFGIDYENFEEKQKPEMPKTVSIIGKNSLLRKDKLKDIAWMDLYLFENENCKKKEFLKKQDFLIDSILKSRLNYLWIVINPHSMHSSIARDKANMENHYKKLSLFTKKLKNQSEKLKVKPPKILVGFEITNNIYQPNLPQNFAVDIYDNEYFDLPNPVGLNFWKNEFEQSLNIFLKNWAKKDINNGIEIAGVVLDLEMYCRRFTGAFLDTMDFSYENLKEFINLNNLDIKIEGDSKKFNRQEIIKELAYRKILQNYFIFLKNKAVNVGLHLKKSFNNLIKDCFIACYAPNISTCWFYQGFYEGLSSADKKMALLTFNCEFKSYQDWLFSRNIFVDHYTVLMLSKMRSKKDIRWIEYLRLGHDGIWYNKFSRVAEDNHKSDCLNIEQPTIKEKDFWFGHMRGAR